MGIQRGNFFDVDVVVIMLDDLELASLAVAAAPVAIIGVETNKQSPSDVARMLRRAKSISNKRQQAIFFTISGYDDDPRELHDIEEVRLWAKDFVDNHSDCLAALVDERHFQDPNISPKGMYHLADGGMGRCKLCILAGYGSRSPVDRDCGGYYLRLNDVGHAILDSLYQSPGQA